MSVEDHSDGAKAWSCCLENADCGPVAALAQRVRVLEELLRRLEWCGPTQDLNICPVCQEAKPNPHALDCELAKALEGA